MPHAVVYEYMYVVLVQWFECVHVWVSTAANRPQAMTQQATRHARRVYVGGLPPLANEQVCGITSRYVGSRAGMWNHKQVCGITGRSVESQGGLWNRVTE
jgi:hypothetical protein